MIETMVLVVVRIDDGKDSGTNTSAAQGGVQFLISHRLKGDLIELSLDH